MAPNELARDFTATRPNEGWVTDITYVWTDEGWAYVAAILDLFSRAVVGWSMDVTANHALTLAALRARRSADRGRPAPPLRPRLRSTPAHDYRSALARAGHRAA